MALPTTTTLLILVLLAAPSAQVELVTRTPPPVVDVFDSNTTLNGVRYACVKIPSLTKLPSGLLFATGEARIGSCADVAGTDLVYRRSSDGGATWDPLRVLHSNSTAAVGNTVGNAAPLVDARRSGRLWVPFNRNNRETWLMYSDNEGDTWSAPRAMPHLQAQGWKWVGLGPPAGLQLKSGRLLVPGYHSRVWPSPNSSSIGSGLTQGHTLYSDDAGETWGILCARFGGQNYANEDQAAQLADGTVVVNSRVLNASRLLSYSTDEGETFFERSATAASLRDTYQGCEGSMVNLPAADGTDRLFYSGVRGTPPSLLLVLLLRRGGYSSTHLTSPHLSQVQGRLPLRIYRENLTIFESLDAGASWDLRETVTLGSSAYSALAEVGADTLGILYERSDCKARGDCPVVFLPEHISFQSFAVGDSSVVGGGAAGRQVGS